MIYLRQSTASQVIKLPKQLDSTDGNTPETGLTIANTDIIIWKNLATSGASKNSGGATEVSNGDYYYTLDATDTDTLGKLTIETHVSGALYTRMEFMVIPATVYDSFVLGSDYLQVDAVQIEGSDATNQLNAATPAVTVSDKTGFSLSSSGVQAIRMEIDNNSTQLSGIIADTNELQTDFHSSGRLDIKLDEAKNTGILKVWNGIGWV